MKLKALIGDKEYIVDEETIAKLDILQLSIDEYHILSDNKSFQSRIIDINVDSKLVIVEINGRSHKVHVQNELDLSILKMGFKMSNDSVANDIIAPMPGLILDVLVEEGQTVEKGQALMVLEAMKMENVLKAEKVGVISKINVKKGTAVDKKAVLIEMES